MILVPNQKVLWAIDRHVLLFFLSVSCHADERPVELHDVAVSKVGGLQEGTVSN